MLIVLGELSSTQLICKYNKIKIVNIEYHTKASRLVFGIEYLRKESQEQLMEISESQLKNLLKHTFLYASDKAYNHFPLVTFVLVRYLISKKKTLKDFMSCYYRTQH